MQSIGAPRSGALALRSGAVLPERCRSAAPGSWSGALSERRSGKRPERTWSASAPTALQQTVKFIRYTTKKFRAARSFFDFNTYEKLDCYTILVCLLILRKFNSPNAYPIGLLAGSWIGDTSFKCPKNSILRCKLYNI